MEACEEDAEVSEEKRRQFISRTKDESEKLVACNTAVGSMAEEPLEGHVSSPPLQISREGDLRIAWKLELSFSRASACSFRRLISVYRALHLTHLYLYQLPSHSFRSGHFLSGCICEKYLSV